MIVDICTEYEFGSFLMWTDDALKTDPTKYRPNKILIVKSDCLLEIDLISGNWDQISSEHDISFVEPYVGDNEEKFKAWSDEMDSWLTTLPNRNLLQSKMANVYDYDLRKKLSKKYCFAMPCKEAIDVITKECSTEYLLELGSGTGYWASIIENNGLKVIATDIAKPYDPIGTDNEVNLYWQYAGYFKKTERLSGPNAVVKYPDHDILLVWPSDHGNWPWYALRRVKPGRKVFMISEGLGGCCGCDGMFTCLQRNYTSLKTVEMPHWPFIYDYMEVFVRNDNVIDWSNDTKSNMIDMTSRVVMNGMPAMNAMVAMAAMAQNNAM